MKSHLGVIKESGEWQFYDAALKSAHSAENGRFVKGQAGTGADVFSTSNRF